MSRGRLPDALGRGVRTSWAILRIVRTTVTRKRVKVGLVVLVAALVAVIARQTLRQADAVYQGRKLSAWVEDALGEDQGKMLAANGVWENLRPGNGRESFQAVLDEVVPHVIRALETRDNPFWKP